MMEALLAKAWVALKSLATAGQNSSADDIGITLRCQSWMLPFIASAD